MAREFMIARVREVGFVPPLTRWQLVVARAHGPVLACMVVAIIAASTLGLYTPLQIVLGCSVFLLYIVVSDRVLRERFYAKSRARRFARAIVGVVLVGLGLVLFAHGREPLWLLLVIPFWRAMETDPSPPWGTVGLAIVAGVAIYSQTSIQQGTTISLTVLGSTLVKMLWLGLVMAILYTYVAFADRMVSSERAKKDFLQSATTEMFAVHQLGKWCRGVLTRTLELTGGTYATFEISNCLTGSLELAAAVKRIASGFVHMDPADIVGLPGFSKHVSTGTTGYVATTDRGLVVPDVPTDDGYVPAFPDTTAAMAVPLHDFIHRRVGAVLNVEFTKETAPSSDLALAISQETLEEIAHELGPVFSYILLSNLQNNLRRLAHRVASVEEEHQAAAEVVKGLYHQYRCPLGVWLLSGAVGAQTLELVSSAAYPADYARSKPKLPLTRSHLGKYLLSAPELKQLTQLSAETVDHWETVRKMAETPVTMLLVPLLGTGREAQVLGVVQLFTCRDVSLPAHEKGLLDDLGQQTAIAIERARLRYADRIEMLRHEATAAAHDLGTSITNLVILVDQLFKLIGEESQGVRDLQRDIQSELEFLGDVRDMVTTSVTDVGAIEQKDFLVEELVSRAERTLVGRQQLQRGRVSIRKIPSRAEKVHCHRPIAVGALRNLFKNAAQAAGPDSGIIVTASLDSSQKFVNIDVRNYGPPIKREAVPRLFDPGHSTKPGGLGVGLGTYRALVARIGGTLDLLESSDVRGTVFRLQLKNAEGG